MWLRGERAARLLGVVCTSTDAVNWSCVTTGAQQLNMVAFGYVYNGIGNDI